MIPITIGAANFPRKIPNLFHAKFGTVNNFEFLNPRTKKTIEGTIAHVLKALSSSNGHRNTNKKIMEKTIPKLLFDEILI